MRRSSLFLTLMMAFLLSFGLANAQLGNIYISSVSGVFGGGPADTLQEGASVTWTIALSNATGDKLTASNNGFRIYSPDGATWNPIDTGDLAEVGGALTAAYGTKGGNWFPYAAPTNTGSGALGDTVGIGGFDSRNPAVGFADGFNAPFFSIGAGAVSGDGLHICITESGYQVNDVWLWALAGGGSDTPVWGPPGSPYGGAVCYTIYHVPNQCPVITNCPVSGSLTFNHCATATYDFNGTDAESDPFTFVQISGPGTTNAGTGVWTYSPTLADVGASLSIEIAATDGLCGGNGPSCVVDLNFTNVCPSFTDGCGSNTNVGKGNAVDVDVDAVSGDCDPISYSLVGINPAPINAPSINAGTGTVSFLSDNSEGNTVFTVTVAVSDGNCADTCDFTITVLQVEPYQVQIEKTHNTIQGGYEQVCVTLNAGSEQMWGFDFLIAYDNSALSFTSADPGDVYDECGWEYFNYRYGANGNCSNACPSGLLRVVGLAETNNGPNHPSCYLPTLPATLFCLNFLVTNDRTFECMYAPIRFFWVDCGDNTISYNPSDDPTGFVQALAVSREIYEFDGVGGNMANGNTGFPTYYGAQDVCLEGGGDGKPAPIRFIDFINGGVDIVCADSIDDRGDINLNGLSNEVADAVLFTNYFIYGLGVFTVNPAGQIAATDVNADGLVLSVADLVYLIRIVIGDALPYPKLAPVESVVKINMDGVLSIADVQVGAASIVLEGNVTPILLAEGMEIKHAFDEANNVTRSLIYSLEGHSFTGEFMNTSGAEIVGIEMATAEGAPILAKEVELPTAFALNQNYPNPFNPKTHISFALPTTSDYTLTIYNVTGQKVTEFNGSAQAGVVDLEVDASSYSSGVYFYKLVANNGKFTDTKKMILVK